MITAMAVMVGVMAGVASVFSTGSRMFSRGQELADVQSVGQSALLEMTRELRQSATHTVTTWVSTQTYVPDVGAAVCFRPPTVLPEGPLVSYTPGNLILYYHDTNRRALVRRDCGPVVPSGDSDRWQESLLRDLLLKTDFVSQRVVAPHLDAMNVTANDQGAVAITMTFKLLATAWNEPRPITLCTTVRARNGM